MTHLPHQRTRTVHPPRLTSARRFVVLLLAMFAVVGLAPLSASAHAGDQSYLYLDVTDKAMGGRVELPMQDVKDVFGIDLMLNGDELTAALEAATPELQAYAAEHLALGANGEQWPIVFTTVEPLDPDPLEPELNYVLINFEVDRVFDPVPRTFEVTFDPLFDEVDDRDGLLLIGNDPQAGVVDNTETSLVRFSTDNRTQTVSLDDASVWKNLRSSIELGIDHIKTGPDHILFVLVLLLPSVLMFGAIGWQPASSFGSALWRVLKIATMFTLAHTITFSLAGLGILPLPPSKFVESVIAISIAAAALHNLRPVLKNKEWAIAFGFGLFHGMGFASLVEGLETSRSVQMVSLLGRNIGIEIGQVVVIILLFPMLFLLRRTRAYRPIFWIVSIALAVVSIGWMFERVFEQDLGINDFVEPLLEFPDALVPVAILTALAAAWRQIEASRGRLLPVWRAADDLSDTPAAAEETSVGV